MTGSRIRGGKAHLARLRKLEKDTARFVGKALFAGGESIQIEAQLSITQGAVSGKNHVPSKPGEPPNQNTGRLGDNIETVQKGTLLVEVSSNAPYSIPLEFGTSKMAARPFMRPARDKKRAEVVALVERAVSQAVRQSRSNAKD
ncbi:MULTISPECIES: HK97-gp10 family putative phage morphogenesis protein [Sphingomonadales]|uniref:HK97-gp10 family putative phage morphogenesis protein n=1 Tax=Sphingomonadales TaxID=204457 RepID=UPI000826DA91|nr:MULTISPECIES: HK97-gp10 family putative phage morphogenesis protein [Sphingomonadales]